jgi:hypothetical protein
MRSSRTISLFNDRPEPPQNPTSFVVSILLHGVVIALVSYVIVHSPGIKDPSRTERYNVRHLDLHRPDPAQQNSAGGNIGYPGPHAMAQAKPPGGKPALPQTMARKIPQLAPGKQTLVQPNLPFHLSPQKEIPVPTVVVWTPEHVTAKAIVPPQPQKPSASDVDPSLAPPNEEVNLADLGVSSSDLAAQTRLVQPSTTSPLVVHGPDSLQFPPETTSKPSAEPTPAAVMSLSDLQMPEGTVALPPVNQTASADRSGATEPARPKADAPSGDGNPAGGAGGVGAGQGAGGAGSKPANSPATAPQGKAKNDAAQTAAPGAGSGPGSGSGSGSGDQPGMQRITLPKDGQFGVVVVGSSLEEKFPETAELWSGRMAYTVYLHVGLAKSWILQYSLPRSAEAAAGGNIARIDAPWPYNIVRPNIPPGEINADALMVHGIVNRSGRFEELSVAFPPDFAQSQFVLDALEQWQFRPAMQDGQPAAVEILLLIPEVQQ